MSQNKAFTIESLILHEQPIDEKKLWAQLEQNANPTFFQSWSWIGPWLNNTGDLVNARLYIAREDDTPIGAAFFTNYTSKRRHFFTSRALCLNESRDPKFDFIIEHNGILAIPNKEQLIAMRIIQQILSSDKFIDEIVFSGIDQERYEMYKRIGKGLDLMPLTTRADKYYYVDLQNIRSKGKDYIDCLSRNTRSSIRKSLREYEQELGGVVILEEALNLSQATQYLERLKHLHQRYWKKKGMPGSFSNLNWEKFITTIIEENFNQKRIQILRISAGGNDIGYILNLIHNGYVNMLQTGFEYRNNKKLKPGYVSHYLAIKHNLQINNNIYDFLAGESQYKVSLSTKQGSIYWLTLQKKCVKYYIERNLTKAIRFLRIIKNNAMTLD